MFRWSRTSLWSVTPKKTSHMYWLTVWHLMFRFLTTKTVLELYCSANRYFHLKSYKVPTIKYCIFISGLVQLDQKCFCAALNILLKCKIFTIVQCNGVKFFLTEGLGKVRKYRGASILCGGHNLHHWLRWQVCDKYLCHS